MFGRARAGIVRSGHSPGAGAGSGLVNEQGKGPAVQLGGRMEGWKDRASGVENRRSASPRPRLSLVSWLTRPLPSRSSNVASKN